MKIIRCADAYSAPVRGTRTGFQPVGVTAASL